MNTERIESLTRLGVGLLGVGIASGIIWRGYNFSDPSGPGVLAPTMCIFFGLSVFITGIAYALRAEEEPE